MCKLHPLKYAEYTVNREYRKISLINSFPKYLPNYTTNSSYTMKQKGFGNLINVGLLFILTANKKLHFWDIFKTILMIMILKDE